MKYSHFHFENEENAIFCIGKYRRNKKKFSVKYCRYNGILK